MAGVGGAVEIARVAGEAFRWRIRVSRRVAQVAGHRGMCSGQWELALAMIERRRGPGVLVVANQAGLREVILGMRGIGRGRVIVLMAAEAFAGEIFHLVVDMAVDTPNAVMRAV